MALQNLSSVFNRFFVVGYFIPSFFALFTLLLLVGDAWLPGEYKEAGESTQALALGAGALVLGLFLSGVGRLIQRVYEGYFHKLAPPINKAQRSWWQSRYRRLERLRSEKGISHERTEAAKRLDDQFPPSIEQVMPTSLGNIMRASEAYARLRYNLNGVMIWPHIELMLTPHEHERLTNERTTMVLFLNLSFLVLITGTIYTVVLLARTGGPMYEVSGTICATVLLSWLFYCALCDAAISFGFAMRSAIDIHRLDLYKRFGVKAPVTKEEEDALGRAINKCIRFGTRIPDDLRIR